MVLHFLELRGQRLTTTRTLRGVATSLLDKSSERTMKRRQKKSGATQRAGDALILLG